MMTPVMTASALCTAVYDGDMPLLRRLLHAGANPNAGDYDKRTALHIAAADGNLPAVRVAAGCHGSCLFLQDSSPSLALSMLLSAPHAHFLLAACACSC
jgi:ankyrin repeat protein